MTWLLVYIKGVYDEKGGLYLPSTYFWKHTFSHYCISIKTNASWHTWTAILCWKQRLYMTKVYSYSDCIISLLEMSLCRQFRCLQTVRRRCMCPLQTFGISVVIMNILCRHWHFLLLSFFKFPNVWFFVVAWNIWSSLKLKQPNSHHCIWAY